MEGGEALGSGSLTRKRVNIQCPMNVEADGSLGQVMECLVVRPKRDIIVAQGHQETWIIWGLI